MLRDGVCDVRGGLSRRANECLLSTLSTFSLFKLLETFMYPSEKSLIWRTSSGERVEKGRILVFLCNIYHGTVFIITPLDGILIFDELLSGFMKVLVCLVTCDDPLVHLLSFFLFLYFNSHKLNRQRLCQHKLSKKLPFSKWLCLIMFSQGNDVGRRGRRLDHKNFVRKTLRLWKSFSESCFTSLSHQSGWKKKHFQKHSNLNICWGESFLFAPRKLFCFLNFSIFSPTTSTFFCKAWKFSCFGENEFEFRYSFVSFAPYISFKRLIGTGFDSFGFCGKPNEELFAILSCTRSKKLFH